MSLRTVLLIAFGSFLTGLAVCLPEHRPVLVLAQCVAFFFAGQGVGEYAEALARSRRR